MAITKNQVNRAPAGFLSLLRAKVGGQTPIDWEKSLRVVLDMTDNYFAASNTQRGYDAESTTNGTAFADLLSLSVPADKLWRLHSLSVRITSQNLTVFQDAQASARIEGFSPSSFATTSARVAACTMIKTNVQVGGAFDTWVPARPYLALPGTTIVLTREIARSNAQNIDYGLSFLYDELPL